MVNENIQALARTADASSEEISTIRYVCVCVCWADSERNKTLAIISQLSPRGLTSTPARLREAQVRLSRPRVLWFTRDAGETWPIACTLSLTAALQQSYTRTADLHQRCASLACFIWLNSWHGNKRGADYCIDPAKLNYFARNSLVQIQNYILCIHV